MRALVYHDTNLTLENNYPLSTPRAGEAIVIFK